MLKLLFRKEMGVILLFLLLCITGLVLVSFMGIQLYPRTNRPAVTSTITHQGYSALAFSQEYAEMIESQLMAIPGQDRVEVRYGNNQSTFTITFDWNVDSQQGMLDAESAFSQIEARLPSDLAEISKVRFSTGENAGFLIIGIGSPTESAENLYNTAQGILEARMTRVEDVETVEILKVEELRAEIELRQHEMLQYGLVIGDIDTALQQGSNARSIGTLKDGNSQLSVQIIASQSDLLDIGQTIVRETASGIVRLDDVADISIEYAVPDVTFVMEGQRGIQIIATPVDGGNIRNMSNDIIDIVYMARETGELPADTQIHLLLDPAAYINRSIGHVIKAAIIGALLAMMVVFMALGKIRNTLLIGISLPVTMVLSFIPLYLMDISLNLISLGGMALAVGMIVDSAIVVIENIHRFRVEENYTPGDRKHLQDLIVRAVRQVRSPVIASTLTSVLVFLPISFTAPLTNAILGEQSIVVVASLLLALLCALTLIPLLAYIVYRKPVIDQAGVLDRAKNISVSAFSWLESKYMHALEWAIVSRKKAVIWPIVSIFILLITLLVLLPRIPREIISPPVSDRVIVFMRSTAGVSSEEMVETVFPEMTQEINEKLGEKVANVYGEVRERFSRLFIVLDQTSDADFVTNELEQMYTSDNEWTYFVLSWDPAQLPLPRTSDLQIRVEGPDETQAVALLERIRDIINEASLYPWVMTVPATNYFDELQLEPRTRMIQASGVYTENQLAVILQKALAGTNEVEYRYEGVTVSARAHYPDELLDGPMRLEQFLLPYRGGAVPLKHYFDIKQQANIAQIASEDGEPIFRLYASMRRGTPATEKERLEEQARELLAGKLQIPDGYLVEFENPQAEMDAAIRSLFISLALSVALIFLLLTFQFNSAGAPLVILVSVPLGFIGLLLSLFVFDSTLSLNSLLGAILMSGVAVNNAIMLVEFFRHMVGQTEDTVQAVLDTARLRFRPIVITTLTTIVGMLPIAIGMGEGANVIRPLGIAVSGGLAVSTVLTIFVVPAILRLFPGVVGRE